RTALALGWFPQTIARKAEPKQSASGFQEKPLGPGSSLRSRRTLRIEAGSLRARDCRQGGLMQREKLSIEDIDAILHHEMTQRLGYDAKDHMMRVNYLAADGEPNWNAKSPAPLPVLNAFIEELAHVKGQYDVNDEDQARLRRA